MEGRHIKIKHGRLSQANRNTQNLLKKHASNTNSVKSFQMGFILFKTCQVKYKTVKST